MKKMVIPILVMVFVFSLAWIAGAQTSRSGSTHQERTGETYASSHPQGGLMEDYKASKLIGMKIQNQQGDNLGKIEDLALNSRGQVDFVIVSHGGVLGLGEKYAAVPFSAFSRKDDKTMTLDMSKEKMAQAPNFDKDKWPDMSNRKWSEDVYHYYGQRPYWSEPSPQPMK